MGTWAAVTLGLAVAAAVQGHAQLPRLLPDWQAFSGGAAQVGGQRAGALALRARSDWLLFHTSVCGCQSVQCSPWRSHAPAQVGTQLVAVIPILATAYTCQMTVHHIMRDVQPFSVRRMQRVSVSETLNSSSRARCGLRCLAAAPHAASSLRPPDLLSFRRPHRCRPRQLQSARCCSYQLRSARSWPLGRTCRPTYSRSSMQVGSGGAALLLHRRPLRTRLLPAASARK